MNTEADIVTWALERPGWQQEVLLALACGEEFDATRISALADHLLDPTSGAPNQAARKIPLHSNAVSSRRGTIARHWRSWTRQECDLRN